MAQPTAKGKVHFWEDAIPQQGKVAEQRLRERLNAWRRSGSAAAGQGSLLGELPTGEIKGCRAGKALPARRSAAGPG